MHLDTKEDVVRDWSCQPLFEIFGQHLPIRGSVVPPQVIDYIWSVFGSKPCNDNIIELPYRPLATTGSGSKLNGRCDISKKRFAALKIMQSGETVTISCNIPTLFDLSKTISAPLLVVLSGLDVW